MKKNLLRIFCIVLTLTMLVGLMPVLAADDITVFVSVSDQGSIGVTKDGKPAAMLEVTVPAGSTVEQAIIAAHTQYCPAGTDGYQAVMGDYGLWMTSLWGKTEGVGLFCVNGEQAPTTADQIIAQDEDCIDLMIYSDTAFWSDCYTRFDKHAVTAAPGDAINLALTYDGYDAEWNLSTLGLAGAAVKTADGKALGTTDAEGKVTLSFAEAGTYVVTAASEDLTISAPVCVVTVAPLLIAPAPAGDITLFVSVSQQGVPALTKDGKPASALEVTVPAGSTVEDAIIAAHKAYCPAGADGWQKAESDWGMSMTMIWGSYDGVGAFYVNGEMPWVQSWEMAANDGDSVDLVLYGPDWSDSYARFDKRIADAEAEEKFALTLTYDVFDENWVAQPAPLAGATVKTADGVFLGTTDAEGKVYLCFETAGEYIVTATSADTVITAPICVVKVTAPAVTYKTYTVKAGDTLWSIAKAQLGSGFRWGELYDANYSLIKNPRMIYVGQVLNIPA